jgi:hypothetical protein
MRVIGIIILAITLLFSFAAIVSADAAFGVSAETGNIDFSAKYDHNTSPEVSKSPDLLILNGDLNLVLVHIYLEYATADMDPHSFTATGLKAGWEFGPSILKAKVFAGYQQYVYTESHNVDYTYASAVVGLGIESKINNLTFYATTLIPAFSSLSIDGASGIDATLYYLNYGIDYAPIPFIDIFVNYRSLKATSDYLDISSKGYTMGAKVSF